ncbi:MAG: HzsA-related protein [Telluria sp.]
MDQAVPRHAALVALLAALAGCSGGARDATAPAIADFSVDTLAVHAGQPARLHWDVRGAAQVTIDPAVGPVKGAGSAQVAPGVTTAYTLTARDARGHAAHASLTVNVQQPPATTASYPILFVTQVPLATDEAARLSAFANHLTGIDAVPRGGDLMLRYPDGTLRNLTQEAGFGAAVAVREPASDWDGRRAIFSMLVGDQGANAFWQLYEATGLGKGEHAHITRVPGQPGDANNVSPLYATDGRILFTSDRPRAGQPHLYPQLDEYEATPTTTGIWSLERGTGKLRILNHTPSGAFSPFIDSYGRVVFTRWDHLQQDQLAQRDRDATRNHVVPPFDSFNYAGEAWGALPLSTRAEVFPESRSGSHGKYGAVNAFANNFFTAWQMNEDGSGEETLNHVGQHELAFGSMTPSFRDDPALASRTIDALHANRTSIRREGGLFQLREDPRRPGTYLATAARDRGTYGTGQLVRLAGAPDLNGEQMTVEPLTPGDPGDALPGGRWRNPLALADGSLVASHATDERAPPEGHGLRDLRLVRLERDPKTGLYRAGAPLTPGIRKSLAWWTPSGRKTWSGALWELEAAELRPRARPVRAQAGLEAPERAVLAEQQVSEDALRDWLVRNNLALIVTRDQTTRDRADLQQPFNLHVPGGVTTLSARAPGAKVYEIAHFQLFEGEQLRAYPKRKGRRVIAQPLHEGRNPGNPGGPEGSVRIAPDGSTAAFVPARRALSWQTTDRSGEAVVRERNWITFQAGEMRVCASCHGVNTHDQAGRPPPMNKPEALGALLAWWKTQPR